MSLNKYNSETGELTTLASGTRIWIGTKSAHDLAAAAGTLPSNCLISIIDDAPDSDATDDYSTEETKTYSKWINGKPIYRKVVDFGTLPNATTKEVTHNITNIDTWVRVDAVIGTSSGTGLSLPFADTTLASQSISCYVTATKVVVNTGSINRSDYNKCYFILEYTKTTD